jgi:proline iminopeptidase
VSGDGGTVLADDGCRLWAADSGPGQPLVLCHGGPGLWDMFDTLTPLLTDDTRAIRWDQRGCGRSDRRGPYSLARSTADLDAVRAHFGLGQMAVLGHSWGATLALRYALDYPGRVSALVYASGTGLGWAWREPFGQEMARRLAPHRARITELRDRDRTAAQDQELAVLQWSAEFTGDSAMRHARQMATPWFGINRQAHDAIWGELERTWREHDLVAACQRLTIPVLIIDGADDIRPRRAVDSLERALPGAVRVMLPGAGHLPWLEAPGAFAAALLDFLHQAGLGAGSGPRSAAGRSAPGPAGPPSSNR